MIRILFALLTICNIAFGRDLGKRLNVYVGTDLYQPQYKYQRFQFDNYDVLKQPLKNISRVSLGTSYRLLKEFPLYLGVRTNRLINNYATLQATDVKTGQKLDAHQKLILDSVYLATYVTKHIAPFIVTTRLESDTLFVYQSGSSVKSHKLTTLYGFGLAYSASKHTLAFTYFLPDDTMNTKRIFGFSYSYAVASFL